MLSLISLRPTVKNIIPNVLKYKPLNISYLDFYGLDLKETVSYKTNLIVVPHGIFLQWVEYLKIFNNLTYYGINQKRILINYLLMM